jgi:hypothetical protein
MKKIFITFFYFMAVGQIAKEKKIWGNLEVDSI